MQPTNANLLKAKLLRTLAKKQRQQEVLRRERESREAASKDLASKPLSGAASMKDEEQVSAQEEDDQKLRKTPAEENESSLEEEFFDREQETDKSPGEGKSAEKMKAEESSKKEDDPEIGLPIYHRLLAAINAIEIDPKRVRIGISKKGSFVPILIINSEIKILVKWKDITKEKVTAITNAANERLWHGAGVAGAICSAGGPSIQRMSHALVEKYGEVSTGACAVTEAGDLPCKFVIHAVGPIWKQHSPARNCALMKCVVLNTLENAQTLPTKSEVISVSIPAISSGIFGFPKKACAWIMIENSVKWALLNTKSRVKEIRFTNFDEETVGVFSKTMLDFAIHIGVVRKKKDPRQDQS